MLNQNDDFLEEEAPLQSKDLNDIFMENSTDILTDNFLQAKKKLLNATNGNSALFDKLRLKGKALDMINMILQSNKEMLKTDDVYFAPEIKILFESSKNDKTLFENTSKKVKTALGLITKNQLSIENVKNYEGLLKILIDVLK